jgi:drug/metabolite transporter (DMT)-like permease
MLLSSNSLGSGSIFNGHGIGNLLFLAAVMAEGSFPIFLKPLLKKYPPYLIAFYCLVCASFYMLPFQSAAFLDTLPHLKWATLGSIAYLGLGCSFLACLLWLTCLKRYSISLVAISWFLQPLFGCLFAFMVLREPITPNIVWGGVLITGALVLLGRRQVVLPVSVKTSVIPVAHQNVTLMRIQHPLLASRSPAPWNLQAANRKRKHLPILMRHRLPHHAQHTTH